jgi:filamentous hemagglutinin family protein
MTKHNNLKWNFNLASLTSFLATIFVGMSLQVTHANPEGGVVSAGDAVINSRPSQVEITQQSPKAVIDWQSFNIEAKEQTRFIQPSNDAIALNRIHSNTASEIKGELTANGKLILINQNGILFGQTAKVDVNGLIATTANISNDKFMQQDLAANSNLFKFDEPGVKDSKIINEGQITAKDGLVGLVAPHVVNTGLIIAKAAKVHLASGETFALDLYGDNLINVAISDDLENQLVLNSGKIVADGNKIALTAAAGKQLVNSLIANSGALQAKSVANQNGEIIIMAEGSNAVINNAAELKGIKSGESKILVSGTIDVSGLEPGESGGKVQILGDNIGLIDNAVINASGHTGKYNTTLGLDNSAKRTGSAGGEILVGGDYLGKGKVPAAMMLTVDPTVTVYSDSNEIGDAGRIIFWSDGVNKFNGKVYARSLGGITGNNYGNGGFVETSGKQLIVNGYVDLAAANGNRGTYLLDPSTISILSNLSSIDPNASQKLNYDTSEDGNTEIVADYIGSLNADVALIATNVIFNLNQDQINLGTHSLQIQADNISINSLGSIKTTEGNLSINSVNALVLTNLDLIALGDNSSITLTSNRNITLGNIQAHELIVNSGVVTTQDGNTLPGSITILAQKSINLVNQGVYFFTAVAGSIILDLQTQVPTGQSLVNLPLSSSTLVPQGPDVISLPINASGTINAAHFSPILKSGVTSWSLYISSNSSTKLNYNGLDGNFDLSNLTIRSTSDSTAPLSITSENKPDTKLTLGKMASIADLTVRMQGSESSITLLATKPINMLPGGSYSFQTEGSLIFNFQGQKNINLSMDAYFHTSAARLLTINIGPELMSNIPCIINSGNLACNFNMTANDLDFTNITLINDGPYGIALSTVNDKTLTLNNIYAKVLGADAGNIILKDINVDLIELVATGTDANSGNIIVAPTTRFATKNISLEAGNNVVFDLQNNWFSLFKTGTLAVTAGSGVNAVSPGKVELFDANTLVNLTSGSGVDISSLKFIGPLGGSVSITANNGSVVLGSVDVGSIAVTASGAGSNIVIPASNKLMLTGANSEVLNLSARAGNIYNQNPVDFKALQILNTSATYNILSSDGTNDQNVLVHNLNGTVNLLGTYDDINVGTNKTVTINDLELYGPDATNYVLGTTTFNGPVGYINPKKLNVVLDGAVSKTYDGSTMITVNDNNYILEGLVGSDVVTLENN